MDDKTKEFYDEICQYFAREDIGPGDKSKIWDKCRRFIGMGTFENMITLEYQAALEHIKLIMEVIERL